MKRASLDNYVLAITINDCKYEPILFIGAEEIDISDVHRVLPGAKPLMYIHFNHNTNEKKLTNEAKSLAKKLNSGEIYMKNLKKHLRNYEKIEYLH